MKKVLKGKIKLIEQEGGYCAPIIEIGGEYLDNVLNTLPNQRIEEDGPDLFDTVLTGEYKITIERIK